MKKLPVFVLCLTLLFPCSAFCEAMTGNVNFFYGINNLDHDDWDPVEQQKELGILLDLKKKTWPISIAIDLFSSEDSDDYVYQGYNFDADGETQEICIGVRKIWDYSNGSPFIGGGLTRINAEQTASYGPISLSEDDSEFGIWLCGGMYWTIGEYFNIGVILRWSQAEVSIGDDIKAGGIHFGATAGVHF